MTPNSLPAVASRRFLFLQGPHGPYFQQLARILLAAGAEVARVGFNAGDEAFWKDRDRFIRFDAPVETWPDRFAEIVEAQGTTDLVLYGDVRPIHARAVEIAKARGITVHVFEEGYLRPYWVTYERGGSNGNSRLMSLDIETMRTALAQSDLDLPGVPAHWGDMRHHVWFGALYHWHVMFRNRRYTHFRPHRALPVAREFRLHVARLLLMPVHWLDRQFATHRITHGGYPYHLALLQLEHDSSFQEHGPFETMSDFLETCITGFAEGAPRHHRLVFKAHPLEDGRTPIRRNVLRIAAEHGVSERVHYVRGGKLAALLDHARSAITVNSTAGQQALWRGLPIRAFGRAVFAKPEFVSTQPVAEFFAEPTPPDSRAYRDYRSYLLETSQLTGGFYSAKGRRQLLRQVVDMMLAPLDPYDALATGKAAPRHQLKSAG
ncbi:capsule biosynthesis protein CapA [Tropicimonas sp. TH_r6]|uniref:capsule biosynthesis protein n=1 Tax=Tropicimonas sp. TH_r6 TaxID=3082085 RepID=UPI0029544D98|nr:capsule biosynthesis protein CapA [Tropicimonas sp. TH_r6]MDV7145746.1 capsule biosynthesis protein CapA [Tropicimonas sp. TH_r6]